MRAATTPVLWTATEAAAATGGRCLGSFAAAGVSIDSRTVEEGDLFVALRGPNFDGHQFIAEAFSKGAVAAVVRKPAPRSVAPLLVVADTMAALSDLGRAARDRSRSKVIAVTGSVGKTGVKEALKLILGRQGPTCANRGSLNNHWGLPLSLARLAPDDAFGIFEMGMNHGGEIEPLSLLARPHVALITTIETAHSAFFADVAEIAEAKAEVFAGMGTDGVAVLNRDNPHFDLLAAAARQRGIARIIGFGCREEADVRLLHAVPDAEGSSVRASVAGDIVDFRIAIPGVHWVGNGLGMLATVMAAGGDVGGAAEAMVDLKAPEGRGLSHTVAIGDGVFLLIDESYNASPASMGAAFEVLGRTHPGAGGRRIAVLGDMLELGADSESLHAALAEPLRDNGIDLVFTVGPLMASLWDALPRNMRGGHAADSETLAPLVGASVRPGDVVTVKGSAGSRTGVVLRALRAAGANPEGMASKRAVNGE